MQSGGLLSSSSSGRCGGDKSTLRWPAGAAPTTLQAAEVDVAGSFLDALLHDFLEDGEEVEGHIADVPVAPDDVVEDEDGRGLWRRRPDGRLGVGLTLAVRHHGHGDVAGADREILRLLVLDHATAERNPSSIDRNSECWRRKLSWLV